MSDSDIEIKKVAPTKPLRKPPPSPTTEMLKNQERKLTTKVMVHEALAELKTRKGVSSYAIKKFLEERHQVDTEKSKYLIKKTLKSGVEDGSIVQLKGIGASGSFKLAAVKEKPKKKSVKKDDSKGAAKEKSTKVKIVKEKTVKEKKSKEKVKKVEKTKIEKVKTGKSDKKPQKIEKPKVEKERKGKPKDAKERKGSKGAPTPSKKKIAMMKRKSIGSIIKAPKMKPKLKV